MDLKGTVKTLAISLGYNFAYGTRQFVNYESTLIDLKNGSTNILMLPEAERYLYINGRPAIDSKEYTLRFQVARKWEKGNATKSELDETYEQKYDRRLSDLRTISQSFIKSLICQNKLEPISARLDPEINVYAENTDLINIEMVFRVPGNM